MLSFSFKQINWIKAYTEIFLLHAHCFVYVQKDDSFKYMKKWDVICHERVHSLNILTDLKNIIIIHDLISPLKNVKLKISR